MKFETKVLIVGIALLGIFLLLDLTGNADIIITSIILGAIILALIFSIILNYLFPKNKFSNKLLDFAGWIGENVWNYN